jgi:hypothetical protein
MAIKSGTSKKWNPLEPLKEGGYMPHVIEYKRQNWVSGTVAPPSTT